MSTSQTANTGPFSTTKVAILTFLGAKVLLALPAGPALMGAIVVGVTAKRLPPAARGRIRNVYAAAKGIVRSRVVAVSRGARQIAQQTNARVRAMLVNGILIVTIWVAFTVEIAHQIVETIRVSIEVWRTDGAFLQAIGAEA